MKTLKAEFFNKSHAYNAIDTIRKLCINIELDSGDNYDMRNAYLSNLNLRHDFFNAGLPGFMSSSPSFPQFNSMTWGSFGMNDTAGYDGGFFTGIDEGVAVLNIEVDEKNLSKVKSKLYSLGASAVFHA